MLAEFHAALGDLIGRGNAALRIALHVEEHDELVEALLEDDRACIARELADLVYIVFGTAHAFAIDLDVALAEIHRAAMSKVLGPGLPLLHEDGKVLKPPGFVPPDMNPALLGATASCEVAEKEASNER
jgi:predicted HAD superfamily Cof-like phosphohydrolase